MGLACSLCDARCCKDFLITTTAFDILRIARATGLKPEKFSSLVEPRMLRVDWSTVVQTKEGDFILALNSKPCIFLEGNRCSIFENAPLACRLYPYTLERKIRGACPTPSKVVFAFSKPATKLLKQYEDEIEAYRKIVKEVSDKKLEKKRAYALLLEMASELISSGSRV